MKKIALILTAIALSLNTYVLGVAAEENSAFYIKMFGGANFLQTTGGGNVRPDYNTGYNLSTSLGFQWCDGLQLEAEYAYSRNSLRKLHYFGEDFHLSGAYQASSFMGNMICAFPYDGCLFVDIRPFLGAGLGYDLQQFHASQDGFTLNQKKHGFAWQLMLGLNGWLCDSMELSLEYKLHKGPLHHTYSHILGMSFTYKFICD